MFKKMLRRYLEMGSVCHDFRRSHNANRFSLVIELPSIHVLVE